MDDGSIRVLLIEDNEDDYVIVRNLLSSAFNKRCTLKWVTTYEAAIEAIDQGGHDVCLLDYRLGERDGIDLLHEMSPKGCKMPVIFLTGCEDHSVDMEAMRAGASEYLVKGEIGVPLLERTIRYAIKHKKTEAKLKAIHEQLRHQNEQLATAHEMAKVEHLRYMDLFDLAPDGYVLTDTEGIIIEINRQAEELLGCSPESAGGSSIVSFVGYEERRGFIDQMGQLKHLRGIKNWQVGLESRYRGPFHAEINVTSVLPRTDEGPTLRWCIRDISERKRIGEELAKHRERLEELVKRRTGELDRAKAEVERKAVELDAALNSIADGVMILGPNQRITRINSFCESLLGCTLGKLVPPIEEKTKSLDFRTTEGRKVPLEELPFMQAFLGKKIMSQQLSIRRKESDKRWNITISASPIKTRDGEFLGVISTFTDMTRQVELTEELRRARDELELRIRERTCELSITNEALRLEIEEHKRTQAALMESGKQLRHLSSRLLSAQEEERKRISREIHDSLGSNFSAVKLALENSMQHLDQDSEMHQELGAIVSIVQGGIKEIRRIMTDLRPSILDDLGIIATIGWLCRQCETVCPRILIEQEMNIEESEIPDRLKIVLFRVIQEALNNICKYSAAELVSLSLSRKGNLMELVVEDNGTGFDIQDVLSRRSLENGIGLTSMKERTELSGGIFLLESVLEEGTTIRATWAN